MVTTQQPVCVTTANNNQSADGMSLSHTTLCTAMASQRNTSHVIAAVSTTAVCVNQIN